MAIATLVSNAVSAVVVILILIFDKRIFVNLTFKNFRLYKQETIDILYHGLLSGLQGCFFSLSNVLIQSAVNGFGNATIAANAACINIESYIYFFLNAIGMATLSMVGQNYGAKKYDNIKLALKYAMILETVCGLVVGGFIILLREPLLKAILNETEPGFDEILKIGSQRLIIICSTHFIDGYMEAGGSYLRGLKKSLTPALITLIGSVILRIIFLTTLFNLEYFHTYLWVTLLYPITWVLTSLAYVVAIIYYNKKLLVNKVDAATC